MKKPVFIVILMVIFSGLRFAPAYADDRDYAAWWVKSYGAVDGKGDPLAARAEKVFEKVRAAADKRSDRFPELLIINVHGDPWALSIKDGHVIITRGALEICYKNVSREKGDSRVAFVLGHELSHLAKNDFWHAAAFAAVKEYSGKADGEKKAISALFTDITDASPDDPRAQEAAKLKELQADEYGLIYMTMAGFDPKSIIADKTNFFEDWTSQITGKAAYSDPVHPSPKERAEFLRANLVPVVKVLEYFHFGVRLYQLGRYEDAILFLEAFKEKFPGREVFNDIGLSHFQLAMKRLGTCNELLPRRFKLSSILDEETLASGLSMRGGAPSEQACLQDERYTKELGEATRYFLKAVSMDPAYIPARVNLASALIMKQDYPAAMAACDEALKIQPGNPDALNNKAIALYLFGKASNIDTADTALGILKEISAGNPGFSGAIYNMAYIQADRGRNAAARNSWKAFLEKEPTGPYAEYAMGMLGTKSGRAGAGLETSSLKSPIKLGDVEGKTEKMLKEMDLLQVEFGDLSGGIYVKGDRKALVLNDTVELVEEPFRETPLDKFKASYGQPLGTVKNINGTTLIYKDFAVDVTDGKVETIVYFEREASL